MADAQLERFWAAFAQEHWERRPLVFRNPLGAELISAARAFECSAAACQRWRARQPVSLRFFLENGLLQSNPEKYLPRPEDGSFQAFAGRISAQLGGQGFAFVLNGVAQYDFEVFLRARRFLRGLYERVGMPGDVTDMDIFVGNYRHTPFGVHTDRASNFSFVLSGRKKFLVWPGPALSGRHELHRSVDFESVRDQAEILEAEAGEVVYWPSSYWHIAESEGELSAVLNIALYIDDTSRSFVEAAIREPEPALPRNAGMLPWSSAAHGGEELPAPLQRALETALEPPPRCGDPRGALLRAWLSRISAGNFHRSYPPPLSAAPLRLGMCVQGDAEFPITVRVDGSALLCAAHGHVLEMPALPGVQGLLERLNSGRAVAVTELVELVRAGAPEGQVTSLTADDVLVLLESLLAVRALRIAA